MEDCCYFVKIVATLGIKTMIGHKIECSIPEERNWIRGVISGIPLNSRYYTDEMSFDHLIFQMR